MQVEWVRPGVPKFASEECQFWDVNRCYKKRKQVLGQISLGNTGLNRENPVGQTSPLPHLNTLPSQLHAMWHSAPLPFSKGISTTCSYFVILFFSLCWNFLERNEEEALSPILIERYLKYPHSMYLFTRFHFPGTHGSPSTCPFLIQIQLLLLCPENVCLGPRPAYCIQ